VLGSDVFCGDALFAGSVGGTGNAQDHAPDSGDSPAALHLGDDMVIHPGHGPATTVLIERLYNPFLIA
jgi:glyoxylase-like metal-dependent hydrolase (beta-lactamase superfamily II)